MKNKIIKTKSDHAIECYAQVPGKPEDKIMY